MPEAAGCSWVISDCAGPPDHGERSVIFFSHIFDLLAKVLSFALFCFVVYSLGAEVKEDRLMAAIVAAPFVIFFYVFVARPLSSWLYALQRLDTRLTWSQARQACGVFCPMLSIHWKPLEHVETLPESERAAAIMKGLADFRAEQAASHRASLDAWVSASLLGKALTVVKYVGFVIAAVLTFMDLPPASWISEFQARWDGRYSPTLTILVLVLGVAIVVTFVEALLLPPKQIEVPESEALSSPQPLTPPQVAVAPVVPVIDNRTDLEKYGPPGTR